MMSYTTLSEFIDEQITRFKIEPTENNLNKIRSKCVRTLKKLNLWENAETKLVERSKTKIFPQWQIDDLYKETEPYFLKIGNIDEKELENYRQNIYKMFEERSNSQTSSANNFETIKVSKSEKVALMIEALYNKYFEPIDEKQWNHDLEISDSASLFDEEVQGGIEVFEARKRLKNPIKSYVKEK